MRIEEFSLFDLFLLLQTDVDFFYIGTSFFTLTGNRMQN